MLVMEQMNQTQTKNNGRSKYTEDNIPVRNIVNGMIVLDNDQKVTGVKIQPRNIFITDPYTQNAIIDNLKIVYNTINYEFWLIVADRPVDIQVYISELQMQGGILYVIRIRQKSTHYRKKCVYRLENY